MPGFCYYLCHCVQSSSDVHVREKLVAAPPAWLVTNDRPACPAAGRFTPVVQPNARSLPALGKGFGQFSRPVTVDLAETARSGSEGCSHSGPKRVLFGFQALAPVFTQRCRLRPLCFSTAS